MDNHFFTRIITYMAYPSLVGSPKSLLAKGSHEVTLGDKERVYTVRRVYYDDSMTPIYTRPEINEPRCKTLAELKRYYSYTIFDSPILDKDNSLRVYEEKERLQP